MIAKSLLKAIRDSRDQNGATMIEYALIAALVAVAAIAGLTALGGQLNTTFNSITTSITPK